MENADLVLVLIATAIGAFAGGILFGMWLVKRMQPKDRPTHEPRTVVSPNESRTLALNPPLSGKFQYGNEADPRTPGTQQAHSTYPAHPAQQAHPSTGRIGWPALRRELEEDDPEAKRYEEIVKANGGN